MSDVQKREKTNRAQTQAMLVPISAATTSKTSSNNMFSFVMIIEAEGTISSKPKTSPNKQKTNDPPF